MTWEIVAGLIAIASCLIGLGTVVFKFSKALTALEAAIVALKEFKNDSKEEHKEMHDKINNHESRISNNTMRIELLETSVNKPNT